MVEWRPFSPKALDFIANSSARLCILHGSVRSSKTINCTVRWLTYIMAGPKGDLCMMGRTRDTLQRNVLNDIRDIVGEGNFKWINKQGGELMIMGRRIYCVGGNNEDAESKIRGATFAGALCDEVNLYPQSVFNQLMARLSVEGAQCFCTCNPDSPYHWFYTDYIKNHDIEDKQIWQFMMEDNLSLSASYVKSLKQMYTGVWYQRMILGLWVAAEGRVYDMFEPSNHLVDTNKMITSLNVHPRAIKWIVGCDYGTSTVMTWGLYAILPSLEKTKTILKVREFYYDAREKKAQKTDAEFVTEFQHWLGDLTPYCIYCDPSAASWKEALRRCGYNVINAENDVINGIREVSARLCTGKYYVDKSCKSTAKEYASYVWDANAQKTGVDKPIKDHDHTCDCDRYVIHTESLHGMSGVYN